MLAVLKTSSAWSYHSKGHCALSVALGVTYIKCEERSTHLSWRTKMMSSMKKMSVPTTERIVVCMGKLCLCLFVPDRHTFKKIKPFSIHPGNWCLSIVWLRTTCLLTCATQFCHGPPEHWGAPVTPEVWFFTSVAYSAPHLQLIAVAVWGQVDAVIIFLDLGSLAKVSGTTRQRRKRKE